jgi:hypothetical protein
MGRKKAAESGNAQSHSGDEKISTELYLLRYNFFFLIGGNGV